MLITFLRNFGHMKPIIIPIVATCILYAACSRPAGPEITVERVTSADALTASTDAARAVMQAFGIDCDSTHWLTFAEAFGQSDAMRIFGRDADSIMPSTDNFRKDLQALYAGMGAALPGIKLPTRVYATVIPYSQSVILPAGCDTVIVIGLNHYLGADYPGYSSFAAYQRTRKEPDRMTRDVAEAIVRTACPFESPEQPTLLQRMLYEEAVTAALTRLQPDDESIATGIPQDDLRALRRAEKEIWQRLVGSDLLFDRSRRVAMALLREGASASVIGGGMPSMTGRFIGWRIAEAYLDSHPEATVESLLRPGFYLSDSTLRDARYAP